MPSRRSPDPIKARLLGSGALDSPCCVKKTPEADVNVSPGGKITPACPVLYASASPCHVPADSVIVNVIVELRAETGTSNWMASWHGSMPLILASLRLQYCMVEPKAPLARAICRRLWRRLQWFRRC